MHHYIFKGYITNGTFVTNGTITKRLSISCLRGVAVLLKDRFDMPGSIGVEGKQQKKTKNYTKGASYVADRAMIENACIKREGRRRRKNEQRTKVRAKHYFLILPVLVLVALRYRGRVKYMELLVPVVPIYFNSTDRRDLDNERTEIDSELAFGFLKMGTVPIY